MEPAFTHSKIKSQWMLCIACFAVLQATSVQTVRADIDINEEVKVCQTRIGAVRLDACTRVIEDSGFGWKRLARFHHLRAQAYLELKDPVRAGAEFRMALYQDKTHQASSRALAKLAGRKHSFPDTGHFDWQLSHVLIAGAAKGYLTAINPKGTVVVSGSDGGSLYIWNAKTGKTTQSKSIYAGGRFLTSVSFGAGGKYIVATVVNRNISSERATVYEVKSGNSYITLDHYSSVVMRAAALAQDGRHVAAGDTLGRFDLFDLDSGKVAWNVKRKAGVYAVAFSARLNLVAGAGGNYRKPTDSQHSGPFVMDRRSGRKLIEINSNQGRLESLNFSRDGRYIAAGGVDRTVRLWDVATGSVVRKFAGHAKSARTVALSNDSSLLVTGSDDGTVKIWSVKSGRLMTNLRMPAAVRSIALSDRGSVLVVGTAKDAQVWIRGAVIDKETTEADTANRDLELDCLNRNGAEAIAACTRILDYSRSTKRQKTWALAWRAFEYRRVGKLKESLDDIKRAIALSPKTARLHYIRGLTQAAMGQHREAIGAYTAAISLAKGYSWAYYRRAKAKYRLKQYAESIADAGKALKLRRNLVDAYFIRAVAAAKLKRYDAAITDLTAAIKGTKSEGRYLYWRAWVYWRAGRAKEGLPDINKALVQSPKSVQRLLLKARILAAVGRNAASKSVYDEVLKLKPGHATAKAERAKLEAP